MVQHPVLSSVVMAGGVSFHSELIRRTCCSIAYKLVIKQTSELKMKRSGETIVSSEL